MAMIAGGIALYRLGRYQEALDWFHRADARIAAEPAPVFSPANLAFQAMSHHRLNHPAEARACLDRLYKGLKDFPRADHANSRMYLHEAEELLAPKAAK
jgi:tetratricopeptide (TPR) repeat protein